jgi:hypothetical protein
LPKWRFHRIVKPASRPRARPESKRFFSEQKKQKTFFNLLRGVGSPRPKVKKVFWFFFSKKNYFLQSIDPYDEITRQPLRAQRVIHDVAIGQP